MALRRARGESSKFSTFGPNSCLMHGGEIDLSWLGARGPGRPLVIALAVSLAAHGVLIVWLPGAFSLTNPSNLGPSFAPGNPLHVLTLNSPTIATLSVPASDRRVSVPIKPLPAAHDMPPNQLPNDGVSVTSQPGMPVASSLYFPDSALTDVPQLIGQVDLDPPDLRHIIASGKVRLTLWVSWKGKVVHARIDESSMPPNFALHAEATFRQAPFVPGAINGTSVGTLMQIEVSYDDGRLISIGTVK